MDEIIYTLLDRKDCTIHVLWSKTTLITGSVGRTGLDSPLMKWENFVLCPWHYLLKPKCFEKKKFHSAVLHLKNTQNTFFAPFNWKLFKYGSINVKDFLYIGGSTPLPPKPPVIRVVSLNTEQNRTRALLYSLLFSPIFELA